MEFISLPKRWLLFGTAFCAFAGALIAERTASPEAGLPPVDQLEILPRSAPSQPMAVTQVENAILARHTSRGGLNDLVLQTLRKEMPTGGKYATNATAMAGLRAATLSQGGVLDIQPKLAVPNFCSGATYLVFLKVVAELQRSGQLALDAETVDRLLVRGQADGVGVWGRWNANGPGTARLFHELSLGSNFTDWDEAAPGDFVKIFWNDGIGSTERGHSAIYLGREVDGNGQELVAYWSSNQSDGFGYMKKERSKIKRVLFSRFTSPQGLTRLKALPAKDDYLAAMLKRPSTPAEMYKMVGASAPKNEAAPRLTAENGGATAPARTGGSALPATPAGKRTGDKAPPVAQGSPAPEKKGLLKGIFSREKQ